MADNVEQWRYLIRLLEKSKVSEEAINHLVRAGNDDMIRMEKMVSDWEGVVDTAIELCRKERLQSETQDATTV